MRQSIYDGLMNKAQSIGLIALVVFVSSFFASKAPDSAAAFLFAAAWTITLVLSIIAFIASFKIEKPGAFTILLGRAPLIVFAIFAAVAVYAELR